MEYFVIYDIADPKRLLKIAKILKGYGLRMQYSKFEASLQPHDLKNLQYEIGAVINPLTDGVKYFPLCDKCYGKCEVFGKGNPKGHDPDFEII